MGVGARSIRAGILKQVPVGQRNRAFEAPELIEAFTALERQLASLERDTLVSEPVASQQVVSQRWT